MTRFHQPGYLQAPLASLTGILLLLGCVPLHGQSEEAETADPFANGGNIAPQVLALEPEEEAEILKEVSVPEGFEVSLFAPWQMANYPVYVAASLGGDLYVSSDGNGSLGRDPDRGRVLRLRDNDGDGRADEVTEFIKNIDSPRGLIWDHDRLYLLHPPHVSVFYDRDGDGVSEESKRLISNIAFGFEDRPADHTSNGLELGIDGWIYAAIGDFGFLNATGSDGRELQLWGGGVVRFRPDGSGLELFASGTRNILATPMSPTLDLFSRDNTNDGGGWDVRFHHHTPLAEHGYPRLYRNFTDEVIAPLADYGGGSGCGGVYIDEPGFPEDWNASPFTVDWGRNASFRHDLSASGATFVEDSEPESFIKMRKPTDADVDGLSAVYQASWRGPATFRWAGPDQGFIVRVTPKDFTPEPLPDFAELSDAQLIDSLGSPSHVRTLAAQRALLRQGVDAASGLKLEAFIANADHSLADRVAAIFALTQGRPKEAFRVFTEQQYDSVLDPFWIRALGDVPVEMNSTTRERFAKFFGPEAGERTNLEAIFFAVRQGFDSLSPMIAQHLGADDAVLRHTAAQALAKLSAQTVALASLSADDARTREAAGRALMQMPEREVVDELISRLETEALPDKRRSIIAVLARLYHREGEWKGSSWGTRPDTRGPYYEPTTWSESERIVAVLRNNILDGTEAEAGFTIAELSRNRIPASDALDRMIEIALQDESSVPAVIGQLAAAEDIPAEALPLVLACAEDPSSPPGAIADAVKILVRSDHENAFSATMRGLVTLQETEGAGKERGAAKNAFLKAPKLENHHDTLVRLLESEPDSAEGKWAAIGLLQLAVKKGGSPESREMSRAAIEESWGVSARKIALIEAAREVRAKFLDEKIVAAVQDPDPAISSVAVSIGKRLKLDFGSETKADPTIIEITALEAQLRFDQKIIRVPVGQLLRLTLNNPDKLAHNLVVVQPGKNREVAMAAVSLGEDGFAKGWLPEHSDIIAATKMLNYGEDDQIAFTLSKPGEYPFVCTFPGHDLTMLGTLVAE
ncbi:MAG: plastocyanin/azurin family copper-binding protein [Verrucomicrobiota bacterium]